MAETGGIPPVQRSRSGWALTLAEREEISRAVVAGHSIRSIATSPAQIDGWLKRTHPDNENFHVSDETIYRSLYIQAHGALKKELLSI